MSEEIVKISNNVWVIRDEESKAAAIVEIAPRLDVANAPTDAPYFSTDEKKHILWGAKDNQPNLMHAIATDNDVKWQLMFARRDFVVGRGLGFGFEKKEGLGVLREELPSSHPNFNEIEEFRWQLNMNGYLFDAAMQVCFSGNVFSTLAFDKSMKLMPPQLLDAMNVRYRALRKGERATSAILCNALFGTKHFKKEESEPMPVFDIANPTAYPRAVLHAKHRLPGNPFYSFPGWWGTKNWTEVANKIPLYHISGLTNGYNLKYLIKVPDDYFDKEGLETQEEKDAHEKAVLLQMKKSLAGEADRAIVTFYKHDLVEMRALPGVEIIPLKNNMTDDAYVSLYNTAKAAQASGHDILAPLASVDTGSKMGGSGKELEVAANFQQKFRTAADRSLLLKPMLLAQRINRWDSKIKFWFEDIEVYNPDVTPKNAGVNPKNPAKKEPETDEEDAD